MRLSVKFSIIYLLSSLLVFTVFGIVYYQFTDKILNDQLNDELLSKKAELVAYLRNVDSITPSFMAMNDHIQFDTHPVVLRSIVTDTLIKLSHDTIPKQYRLLVFTYKKKDVRYKISISKELYNTNELKLKIIEFDLYALFFLLILLSILNFMVSKILLQPLQFLTEKFQDFDIRRHTALAPIKSSTSEFKTLHTTFQSMFQTIQLDFDNLRLFTENASHEMQTPLTVIKNSVELLIQKEGYDQAQIKLIQNISNNSNKLKKIHNDLLLLSKLEGNYFEADAEVNYQEIMLEVLHNYEPLRESRNVQIVVNNDMPCIKQSNSVVAFLLFNNLISNAIKHSTEGSEIHITLNESFFRIQNQGQVLLTDDSAKLFERFYKEGRHSDSTGLGLAMVKQICVNMHYQIEHTFNEGTHTFNIQF